MPEPANTLLIEGSFEELAEELAQYLDNVKKTQSEDGSSTVHGEVMRLLEQNQKDDVLKKLVTASVVLNSAPEKGMPDSVSPMTLHDDLLIGTCDRVHTILQSPGSSCTTIAQREHVSTKDLSESFESRHVFSSERSRNGPVDLIDHLQYPTSGQRHEISRLSGDLVCCQDQWHVRDYSAAVEES